MLNLRNILPLNPGRGRRNAPTCPERPPPSVKSGMSPSTAYCAKGVCARPSLEVMEEGVTLKPDVFVRQKGRKGLSILIERAFTGWQSQYSSNAVLGIFVGNRTPKDPRWIWFASNLLDQSLWQNAAKKIQHRNETKYMCSFFNSRYAQRKNGLQS